MKEENIKKSGRRSAPKSAPKSAPTIKKRMTDFFKKGKEKFNDLDLQPIWDRTGKELNTAFKAISKGTEKAAQKTATLSKQAGLQSQVYLNQLKLQKKLAELGGRIYDLAKAESAMVDIKDPGVMAMILTIKELDENVASLKVKIQGLKKIPPKTSK